MAIFMQNIDGYKVLVLLKVPGPLIEKMQVSGVSVQATATSLKFMQGAEVLSSIVVKATVLKELMDKGWDGKGAEYMSLSVVAKHAAEQVVKELTEGPAQPAGVPQFGHKADGSAPSTVSLLQKAASMKTLGQGAAPQPEPTPAPSANVFPPHQMTSATPVKLREALQMYQPVQGTGAGSRYFVVAVSPDLKVAARYKGDKLSVRVEGQNLPKYVPLAKAAGFNTINVEGGPETHYFSLHLSTGDAQMTARALGAVLCSLGLEFQTPLPKISVFAGKGV